MKIRTLFVIVLILLIAEFSYGQDPNFNFIGAGARARGMGGAFIGLADDATAMSWNPAGLSKLETPEASVVGSISNYSVSSDIEDFDEDPYKSSHANLNFISGAIPLNVGERNLVAGISYQQIMDLYYSYDEEDWYREERTGGVYAITPAVGVQLTPTFSLGASVNIYTGKTEYEYEDYEDDFFDESAEYNFSGTNFNIGALFDYDKFRFGAVFKTAFDLKEELDGGDYEGEIGMPNIFGLGLSYVATENLTLAADYEMRSFSESEISVNGESSSLEWEDVNQFRIGGEYLYISGTNIIPLRLGFATTPSLYADSEGDQITGFNVTGGVGIIMGNINLDLGVEYNKFSYEIQGNRESFDYSENYLRFIIAGVFHFNN